MSTNLRPARLPANHTTKDWNFFKSRLADFITIEGRSDASGATKMAILRLTIGRDGSEIQDSLKDYKTTLDECKE